MGIQPPLDDAPLASLAPLAAASIRLGVGGRARGHGSCTFVMPSAKAAGLQVMERSQEKPRANNTIALSSSLPSIKCKGGGAGVDGLGKLTASPLHSGQAFHAPAQSGGTPRCKGSVDYVVKHVLKRYASMDAASKCFQRLRERPDKFLVGGLPLGGAEIAEAERRCQAAFGVKGHSGFRATSSAVAPLAGNSKDADVMDNVAVVVRYIMQTFAGDVASADIFLQRMRTVGRRSKLGYIFSEEELSQARSEYLSRLGSIGKVGAAAARARSMVDVIAQYIMERFEGMGEAGRFFYLLEKTAGEVNQLSLIFTRDDIVEARSECAAVFQAKATDCGTPKGHVDLIVKYVLKKFEVRQKAEQFFDTLHLHVGRSAPPPLSRVFTLEEVTEAWLRCTVCYDEQEELAASELAKRSGPQTDAMSRLGTFEETAGDGDVGDLSGDEGVDQEGDATGGLSPADLLADLGVSVEPAQASEDGYKAHLWQISGSLAELLPGAKGFNKRATAAMLGAEVGASEARGNAEQRLLCPPLQAHQEAVAFLLHPRSPMSRLLVDHPTGSGKTREMIRVLDNYFYDPRPKVPIFPRDAVCRNFYMELLRWPSRYRDYFACERPADAAMVSGSADWRTRRHHMWDPSRTSNEELRRLCGVIRDVLEMKGQSWMGQMRRSFRVAFQKKHPGMPMPLAPLRAISYVSAGGSFSAITETAGKLPASALMKIGYERGCGNVYTNKVVVLDEAHNLVRSQSQFDEQLRRLRFLLVGAQNLVLAGFTGTPILNEATEGRQLLDIIKGQEQICSSDEGFLSSFQARPMKLFASSMPRGIPDKLLTAQRRRELVKRVELQGEALRVFDTKRQLGLAQERLRAYCNVCCYYASFHDGQNGAKARIMANPEGCCPKLHAVAHEVASFSEKALVLIGRPTGHKVMLELMRHVASLASPSFGVATLDELAEFNHVSNLRGEKYRVLVADATQCSEGISFLAVRRSFMADVPPSYSQFVQQCGRSLRMYGHHGLPVEEQVLVTRLYVATFPKWMSSSLACFAFRAQNRTGVAANNVEARARLLLARLRRAGMGTLAELKSRVDAHVCEINSVQDPGSKEPLAKPPLSSSQAADLLERHGLWEEGRLLRPKAHTAQLEPNNAGPAQKPRAFLQALQDLHAANNADDPALSLDHVTADEKALLDLANMSKKLVPALTEMRGVAVDRDIFASLAACQAPSADEASADEFDVEPDCDDASARGREATGQRDLGTPSAEGLAESVSQESGQTQGSVIAKRESHRLKEGRGATATAAASDKQDIPSHMQKVEATADVMDAQAGLTAHDAEEDQGSQACGAVASGTGNQGQPSKKRLMGVLVTATRDGGSGEPDPSPAVAGQPPFQHSQPWQKQEQAASPLPKRVRLWSKTPWGAWVWPLPNQTCECKGASRPHPGVCGCCGVTRPAKELGVQTSGFAATATTGRGGG